MDPDRESRTLLASINAGYDQQSDPASFAQTTVAVPVASSLQPQYVSHVAAYPGMVTRQPSNITTPTTTNPAITSTTTSVTVSAPPSPPTTISTLAMSIFCCLCCCWPLGIQAIVFAAMAHDAAKSGNVKDARKFGWVARGLNIATLIVGLMCHGAYVIYFMLTYLGSTDDVPTPTTEP